MNPKIAPLRQEDSLALRPSWRSYFVFYAAILVFGIGPSLNPDTGINRSFGWALSILILVLLFSVEKPLFIG